MSGLTLSVGPKKADYPGETNRAIQDAVDAACEAGGGTVQLGPGRFIMEDSLHLRGGVTVRGHGEDTILWKPSSVSSRVLGYLGYGHFDVSMLEPEKFRVGMGVHIHDDRSMGFYDTVATLTWHDGERFGLSRFLNHDYGESQQGTVTSVYPIVSGYGLEKAVLENLSIDGNAEENEKLNGCRGGGVFLYQTHEVTLREVTIRNYNGDGISFQQCLDTRIEDCRIEGCTGGGVHPGSGSVRSAMSGLKIRGNGRDGVFYCLRVSYSLLEDCEIRENGGCGVSIGGRDTNHLIRANSIRGNGEHGVHFRPGSEYMGASRNVLKGNRIGPNGGGPEVFLENITKEVHILENVIEAVPDSEGTAIAIRISEECEGIVISGNTSNGETDARCAPEAVLADPPFPALSVGPGAAPENAGRHLFGKDSR